MLTVSEVNQMGAAIESWLRMRVHPIAFKLLKEGSDLPEDTIVPSVTSAKISTSARPFQRCSAMGSPWPCIWRTTGVSSR